MAISTIICIIIACMVVFVGVLILLSEWNRPMPPWEIDEIIESQVKKDKKL